MRNTAVAATAATTVETPNLEELGRNHERFGAQAAEQVVNPIVLAELLGCRPQMIYNYIRNGKIEAVKHNNTQKIVIPMAAAQEFADRYLTRKAEKLVKVQQELATNES